MMRFYLDAGERLRGQRHVHKQTCVRLARTPNKTLIGKFERGEKALEAARSICENANGCDFCLPRCHSDQ